MTDLVSLFTRSIGRFGERVEGIADDGWAAATPCDAWDARALVNHVTYEQRWAPHLVAGETIAEVGDRYEGDILGADPKASWREAAAGSVAAFAGTDLDATVHLSYGDVPGREYLTQMLTDTEIHGWDLAKATGQDTTIDPEVATVLLDTWTAQEALVRASGVFGDAVAVPEGADVPTRLLALLGRQA